MLLTELREQIEAGKTATLFIPKTYEYGFEMTINVFTKESQLFWQREKIDNPVTLPAKTMTFETWEKLIETLQGGMQLRDNTWEIASSIEGETHISNAENMPEVASEVALG